MMRLLIRDKEQATMKFSLKTSMIAMYGNGMMVNTSCGSIMTLTIGLLEALLEAVEEYLHLRNLTVLMTQAVNGHTMKWDHPIHS